MCGIVGVFGNLNAKNCKAFRDMLLMDTLRGEDSTGVVAIPFSHSKQDPIIEKDLGLPPNLWETTAKSKIFGKRGVPKATFRGLIGHNRAATIGNICVNNAHPFQFDHVYGVHNGTLRYYYDLDGYTELETDSMALYNHISNNGIKDTWKNFTGAAARS